MLATRSPASCTQQRVYSSIFVTRNSLRYIALKLFGSAWDVWCGHATGDGLGGAPDIDERIQAFAAIDLSRVRLETCLIDEQSIRGEPRLVRLRHMDVLRLNAEILATLLESPWMIPPIWKRDADSKRKFIFFDGTIFRSPDGERHVLYLTDDNAGGWKHGTHELSGNFDAQSPSAIIDMPSA